MKNEMKTKVMIAGAAFCAALFLFSGFMLCREYLDQKQSAEAFDAVAELVKEEPELPAPELENGQEPVQEEVTAFEKYADVYAQNSDLVGWVSIGLYLAREIITMQGGYILVTSEVGKGSTFSVFLPQE